MKGEKTISKYWVIYNNSTDTIFIDTIRETQTDAIEFFAKKYGAEQWLKNKNIEVILVELKRVNLEK